MRPPITRTSCTASSYPPPFSFLACEGGLPTRRIAIPLEYPRVYSGGMSGSTDAAIDVASRFLENLESVIRGKHEEIKLVLAALACRGHVLFEDVPGTAKTVLARAIARSVEGAKHARIQCTPDLQPTDDRPVGLQPAHTRLRVPRRADLRQHRARRRDQPRHAQDAVRTPRGD